MSDFGGLVYSFQVVEGARPALLEQPRKRAVGEDLTAGLAARAVIRLVLGVHDALHRRAAYGARLAVASMDGHVFPERGDLFGKPFTGLTPQAFRPFLEHLLGGSVETGHLVVRQI